MTLKSKKTLAIAALFGVTVIWGLTFIIIKSAVQEVDPIAMAGYRFAIPVIILGGYLGILKKRNLTHQYKYGLITGFYLWLFFVFQNVGLLYTSASNASFLSGLFVVFTPFLAYGIYKELITRLQIYVLGISMTGMWIITGGVRGLNIGDILLIASAGVYALYLVCTDHYVRIKHSKPLMLSFQQYAVITAASFAWVLLTGGSWSVGSLQSILSLLYLAFLASLGGFTVLNIVQKYLQPFTISLIQTSTTILGAVFAWTLGGEVVTSQGVVGGLLMVIAIVTPPVVHAIQFSRVKKKALQEKKPSRSKMVKVKHRKPAVSLKKPILEDS